MPITTRGPIAIYFTLERRPSGSIELVTTIKVNGGRGSNIVSGRISQSSMGLDFYSKVMQMVKHPKNQYISYNLYQNIRNSMSPSRSFFKRVVQMKSPEGIPSGKGVTFAVVEEGFGLTHGNVEILKLTQTEDFTDLEGKCWNEYMSILGGEYAKKTVAWDICESCHCVHQYRFNGEPEEGAN